MGKNVFQLLHYKWIEVIRNHSYHQFFFEYIIIYIIYKLHHGKYSLNANY